MTLKRSLFRTWLVFLLAGSPLVWAADQDWVPKDYSSRPRVALVIGNGAYQSFNPLSNAVSDARLIADSLGEANFDVLYGHDLDADGMWQLIEDFGERLRATQGGVGFFYYSGHGAGYQGANYMIPVKSKVKYLEQLASRGVSVSEVQLFMEKAGAGLRILVLDQCRDLPKLFTKSKDLVPPGWSSTAVADPAATFIHYATARNKTAGDYSGYARFLSAAIAVPGQSLYQVFTGVGARVQRQTQGQQVPWIESAFSDQFYFVPGGTNLPVQQPLYPVGPKFVDFPPTLYPVGHLFRDALSLGGQGPQMVVLPTGSFHMGDLRGKGEDDEQPVRLVTISRPIAMMTHEVTFDDYDRYARATRRSKPDDEGWGRGTRPVVNVNLDDAQGYARWLSGQTGKRYRLPSEAEWEYAARAGSSTRYFWGNIIGSNRANCDGCGSRWDNEKLAPAGSFPANDWGLYDMHGNVWEFVQDCYHNGYSGAPSDGRARESGDCTHRVMRGGSWNVIPAWLRSAYRHTILPGYSYNVSGFRLVQDLSP